MRGWLESSRVVNKERVTRSNIENISVNDHLQVHSVGMLLTWLDTKFFTVHSNMCGWNVNTLTHDGLSQDAELPFDFYVRTNVEVSLPQIEKWTAARISWQTVLPRRQSYISGWNRRCLSPAIVPHQGNRAEWRPYQVVIAFWRSWRNSASHFCNTRYSPDRWKSAVAVRWRTADCRSSPRRWFLE